MLCNDGATRWIAVKVLVHLGGLNITNRDKERTTLFLLLLLCVFQLKTYTVVLLVHKSRYMYFVYKKAKYRSWVDKVYFYVIRDNSGSKNGTGED